MDDLFLTIKLKMINKRIISILFAEKNGRIIVISL